MKDDKIIITVGRQIGSGGRTIAKILSEQFHCSFYDKEILNLAAKESGLCEKFLEKNDEHKGFFGRKNGFCLSLGKNVVQIFGRKIGCFIDDLNRLRKPGLCFSLGVI